MPTIAALLAVLIAICVGAALPARAQPPGPAAPPELPPIVVEGERLPDERTETDQQARERIERVPGGAAVVGQPELEDTRRANLKDALDFVPGVLIRPRIGAADESQLSIRGSGLRNNFHLRGVNILIDGFPYGNADGFSDFESLDLNSTKRIEVLRGANALRFGANSLGGAINLVTKTGHDAGLIDLASEGGSFGYYNQYVATGQVYGPFDLYVGNSIIGLDGFREHSEQFRYRLYTNAGYALPGGTTVRLDVSYVDNRETLPGSLTPQEFEQDPRQADPAFVAQDAQRNYSYVRGGFTVRTPITPTDVVEWKSFVTYQDLDHPLPFAVIDDVTTSWGTELRYTRVAPLFDRANRLTAGFQYFASYQTDVNFQNNGGVRGAVSKDQGNQATNLGFYAENQFDVVPTLSLIAGIRYLYAIRTVRDHFPADGDQSGSAYYSAGSPKLGAIWHIAPTAQLYGNASSSYEVPAFVELTAPGNLQGSLRDLNAQFAWQFEVGTRGTWGRQVAWDISAYDIELWNELQNVNVLPFPTATFTIPRFQNIPRSRHTGVEVGFDVVLLENLARWVGLGSAGDTLRSRTAYTWSRFVFVNNPTFGNNDLPGAPSSYIRSELRYDHASGFWFAPGMEWVPTGYFVDSANTVRTPAYVLGNIRMGYDYQPWQLGVFFEARNLANTNFVSAVVTDSGTGRFFDPGDGRAFYGRVAWRFR
ncbi:MAG: TonB-dependent receptor [Candidatus Rokubacteria bacterium]|nr:TonB-dependent receptor [Candidatus Rokubacteria bacterium]